VTPGEIGDDGTTDPEGSFVVEDAIRPTGGGGDHSLPAELAEGVIMQFAQAAQYRPEPSIPIRDAVPCMELAGMIATLPPALRHEVCAAFFMRFGAAGKRIDIAEFWKACDIPPE
jgi:hypothetical protein